MTKSSIRIGFSTRDERRPPGIGRNLGLFHMSSVGEDKGRTIAVGRLTFERGDLEPLREKGIRVKVTVIGILRLSDDISPALAQAVLDARVFGWIFANPKTKAALTAV